VLWFKDTLVVPKDRELKNQIISEAHSSKLSIHPGSRKMYHDLKCNNPEIYKKQKSQVNFFF
jgi:hypothetical protein